MLILMCKREEERTHLNTRCSWDSVAEVNEEYGSRDDYEESLKKDGSRVSGWIGALGEGLGHL
ncbi:hypothetical protein KI387_013713, partial [Taxus chinensis]